jgi:hypothetical protein
VQGKGAWRERNIPHRHRSAIALEFAVLAPEVFVVPAGAGEPLFGPHQLAGPEEFDDKRLNSIFDVCDGAA